MQRINFFAIIIILLFPLTTGAVPQLLKHQGHMLNNQGVPIVGSANVTFNLYENETGGDSLWTQTIPVTFDSGYYSVVLGPGTPELSVALFTGSDLYLGVTLEGQNEFLPRMQLATMPYAFRAEAVEGEVKAVGGLIVDGQEVINDQQQWIGTNISFNDLADIPSDLADGDDVGLEGSGTDGTLAKFTESGLGDSVLVESDGKIGVGTGDPQATVQIAGGMQIEDDTDDCVEGKEGTLRWHENKVEVCDGTSWGAIASTALDGQSQGQAGTSCKSLLDSGASQNGIYWINPGGQDPFQIYCDMETEGGGWTLVALVKATSNTYTWDSAGVNQNLLTLDSNNATNDADVESILAQSRMDDIIANELRLRSPNQHMQGIADADFPSIWNYYFHCTFSLPNFSTMDSWVEAHVTIRNITTDSTTDDAHCWDLNSNAHVGWSSSASHHMLLSTTNNSHRGFCLQSTCWSERGSAWIR